MLNQLMVYRVEQQTLPVEFLLNFYRMLQDMKLKIDTDNPLVLSYDMIKAWNIDSASVSVMTKIKLFFKLCYKIVISSMCMNQKISTFHRLKVFIRAL